MELLLIICIVITITLFIAFKWEAQEKNKQIVWLNDEIERLKHEIKLKDYRLYYDRVERIPALEEELSKYRPSVKSGRKFKK